MKTPKWTMMAAIALVTLTAGCTPTSPAPAGTSPGGGGDVAILVLDGFSSAAEATDSSTSDGKANCFRMARGANEVGSGGGGDGLPAGVSHGQAVFEVAKSELNQPGHGLTHVGRPPAVAHRLVPSSYVDNWRSGDRQVLLVGVDTAGYDTGLVATELAGLMDVLRRDTGITRFVVNMSFLVLPCDIRAWFDGRPGGTTLTADRVLATYRAIVDGVPDLARLAAELDRLERGRAPLDALLTDPALADARPLLPVNLFYGPLAGARVSDLTDPNGPPLPRAIYQRITDDPLKRRLDKPPAGYRVVAVGAAGNGIFRLSPTGGRGERVQFDFPFAPALWDSVVSVSATGQPPARADYSNGGEVMLDASNAYRAGGTSFAAPRLSVLQALYLRGDGPVTCDGSTPPLGYTRVGDPGAPAGEVPRWDNLALGSTVSPGDPALAHCREFAARVAP